MAPQEYIPAFTVGIFFN